MGHNPVVKGNLRNFRIRKHISENIRFLDIVQYVHMLFDFKKVVFLIHCYRAVGKSFIHIHVFLLFSGLSGAPAHGLAYSYVSQQGLSYTLSLNPCIIVYNYTFRVNIFLGI